MNIIEAILSQNPNDTIYIARKRHKWYLKVSKYESVKYWNDGQLHSNNYLTTDDYLSTDWYVYNR